MEDYVGGTLMTKPAALTPKKHRYLIDDGIENKKAKGTKNCIIKWQLKVKDFKSCKKADGFKNEINY